jgi:plasmid replication initiation protein
MKDLSLESTPANTPETLGVTPRFVLQHNAISRSIQNLSATAKKLTAMAMALLPPDLSSLTASFSFADFNKALDYGDGGKQYQMFRAAVRECLQCIIHVETPPDARGKKDWQEYTWFTYAEFSEKTGQATMKFSPELAEYLKTLKWIYSKINLQDLGKLQSKYALRYYEMAKSYESLAGKEGNEGGTWYFERPVQELRTMLGVPDEAYPETRDFRKYVVEQPVKEINAAGVGLEITTEGIKQGRNLKAIRFDCEKAAPTLPAKRSRGRPKKTAATAGQLELPEANPKTATLRKEKEHAHLKELYPEEFAKLYAEGLTRAPTWSPVGAQQISAEGYALTMLQEKHGIVK